MLNKNFAKRSVSHTTKKVITSNDIPRQPFNFTLINESTPINYPFLFSFGLIIVFLRSYYAIATPYIFTEDSLWMSSIINDGFLHALFFSKNEYFVFGNILLLGSALVINFIISGYNLSYLPQLIILMQYIFFVFVAVLPVICFKNYLSKIARLFIYLYILVLPVGDNPVEIFGRISNIGYLFVFAAFCLLMWRFDRENPISNLQLAVVDVLLFISCTTNPACYPMVFIFFLGYIWKYYRADLKNPSIEKIKGFFKDSFFTRSVILLCVLGFMFILSELILGSTTKYDFPALNFDSIIEFLTRIFLYQFIPNIYHSLTTATSVILLVFVCIIFIFVLLTAKGKEKMLLTCAGLTALYYALATFVMRYWVLSLYLSDYVETYPERYYYGVNIIMLLLPACLLSIGFKKHASKISKTSATILLSFILIVFIQMLPKIIEYDRPLVYDPSFKQDLLNVYLENGNFVVDKGNWSMQLPPKYYFSSLSGRRTSHDGMQIQATNITDSNWIKGIHRDFPIVLFEGRNFSEVLLKHATGIYANGTYAKIVPGSEVNGTYIHATVDCNGDLSAFEYPAIITVEFDLSE